jgi:hypothetical protein
MKQWRQWRRNAMAAAVAWRRKISNGEMWRHHLNKWRKACWRRKSMANGGCEKLMRRDVMANESNASQRSMKISLAQPKKTVMKACLWPKT